MSNSTTKTSFELEPNPFEQSFASKDKQPPNIGTSTSPQILTPGGRKLPPLVLSPNVPSSWGSSQFPRTGLTPNESSLRTGLTPGGVPFAHSLSNMAITGLNTPGGSSLGFSGFTPGLSSLLGANTKEFGQAQANNNNVTVGNVPPAASGTVREEPASEEINDKGHAPPAAEREAEAQEQAEVEAETEEAPVRKSKRKSFTKKTEEPKRKKAKKKDVEEELEEEINTENMTEEEKRKNFLERNRVAASKCRQRKKQQIQKMESDLNFYLNEYNNLTSTIDSMKEQCLLLRTMLLAGKQHREIVPTLDTILNYINQTNYMSRLRGDNPQHMIPTVQPINPVLVQQNQPVVGPISQVNGLPVQPVQSVQQSIIPVMGNNVLPQTVANGVPPKGMEWAPS